MLTPDNLKLTGKTALVTGAARGIGYATAETLASFGADILLLDKDAGRLEDATKNLDKSAGSVAGFDVDVTDDGAVQALAGHFSDTGQQVDILVNNVGDHLNLIKPFLETSAEEWDELYAVNLRQLLSCTRAFAPLIRDGDRGGSIINISSIEGYRAIPTCAVYGALKTAISGFVRSMAMELAPYKIRINAVAPETTETEQVDPKAFTPPQYLKHWDVWNPLGRWGQPQDTASRTVSCQRPQPVDDRHHPSR